MYNSIRPRQVWLDTDGDRIQAHGGSVIYIDGTYYFYGENKEKTDGKNGIRHWGIRAYSSKDLYNWKNEGIIIEPSDDITSSLHPENVSERPHIITSISDYVWLPLRFEPPSARHPLGMVYIDWLEEWRIEDYE